MPQYFKEHGERLIELGYPIVPLPPGSKGPRQKGWQHLALDVETFRKMAANGSANAGTGILAAHFPAVDVDVMDEAIAEEMSRILDQMFGTELLARIGRAPKFLVPFRTSEPFRKLLSNRYTDGADVHRVEILGEGQQWVAFHVHPDTGKPYYWGGGRSILDVERDDLPVLDRESAQRIVNAFEAIAQRKVAAGEWWVCAAEVTKSLAPVPDDPFAAYQPPVSDLSIVQIEKLIHKLDWDSRDDWVRAGRILHHQFEGSDEGFEIWNAWATNSPKWQAKTEAEVWDSFGQRHDAPETIRSLIKEFGQPATERPKLAESTKEDPFPFHPGDEYMRGFENVQTLIEDLFPDQGVAMIYGASLTGKTFWTMDVAFAVQNGAKWRDKDTRQGSVFYIAAEAGRGIRKRIAAYKALNPDCVSPFFADTAPNLADGEWTADIVKSIQLRGGAALVVIDTLSASFQGDDSSQQETAIMIQNCSNMAKTLNCLVAFVHHAKKDNASWRGSGTLFNDVDAVVEVTAEGEGEARMHCATVTKQKDDEMGQRYGFRLLKSGALGFKANGKPLTSCTIEHIEAAPRQKSTKAMNDSVSFLKEVYDTIAPLDDGVTVQELLEASKEKYGETNGAGFRGGNYRRALARFIGFEGVRLPDETVVRL